MHKISFEQLKAEHFEYSTDNDNYLVLEDVELNGLCIVMNEGQEINFRYCSLNNVYIESTSGNFFPVVSSFYSTFDDCIFKRIDFKAFNYTETSNLTMVV